MHWDDPEGWDGEGGGRAFRMGNKCTPVADPCQCMAKPLQYCKVKKKKTNRFRMSNENMVYYLTYKKKKKNY